MFVTRFVLACGLLAGMSGIAGAQDATLSQIYGQGVHAYFAGDYGLAQDLLSEALASGYQDPRCHYFLGLARLHQGEQDAAEGDFAAGARLEAEHLNEFTRISRALARVQGPFRQQLEKHRAEGRLLVMRERDAARKARYESIRRAIEIESRPAEEPAEELPAAPADEPPAAESPADAPAAAVEPELPSDEPEMPADEPEMPAAEPAGDDPFADEDAAGPALTPADRDRPMAPARDNPPAADNPFAEDEPAAPAAAPTAPNADNPFAEDEAAPADEPEMPADEPASPAPAPAASDDPFAEEDAAPATPDDEPATPDDEPATPDNSASDDPFAEPGN